MEVSKEILLLLDSFQVKNFNEQTIVNLIRDIYEGLNDPHTDNEINFWKVKVSVYLLNNLLVNKHIVTKSLTSHNKFGQLKLLSWNLCFKICIKAEIFNYFIAVLFSALKGNLLHSAMESCCQEIDSWSLPDCSVWFSMVVTQLGFVAHESDFETVTSMLFIQLKKVFCSSEFIAQKLSDFHVNGLKQAINSLKSVPPIVVESNKNTTVVDIAHLNKLKSNTLNLPNLIKDAQSQVCNLKDIFQEKSDEQEYQNDKLYRKFATSLCYELLIVHKRIIDDRSSQRKTSDVISEAENNYMTLLHELHQQLNCIITLHKEDTGSNDLSLICLSKNTNKKTEMNIKSALFCIAHYLDGHEKAAIFLLNSIFTEILPIDMVQKCMSLFTKHPEIFFQSKYICKLCSVYEILRQRCSGQKDKNIQNCLDSVYDLIYLCYSHLPLKSKMCLLGQQYDSNCKKKQTTLISKGSFVHFEDNDEVKKQINLIFNQITKAEENTYLDSLLHKVCNVAFFDPHATLKKIVKQVAHHDEHHDVLSKVLQQLTCLICITDINEKNVFLNHICSIAVLDCNEQLHKNTCCFLLSLLKLFESSDIDTYVTKLVISELLSSFILPSLSCSDDYTQSQNVASNLPHNYSLDLLACLFSFEQYLTNLLLFDLFSLILLLARLLDESQMSDEILLKVKYSLTHLVETIQYKIFSKNNSHEDMISLCKWLQQSATSMHWTTQLYLRPILSRNENYCTILPKSITTICDMSNISRFELDDSYGEGTGLTAWLQCLVIDPSLFPISSLMMHDVSTEALELFRHGMVVALSQTLPYCGEGDWHIILEGLKGLIDQYYLFINYPTSRSVNLPLLNLRKYHIDLSILEVLHHVTNVLGSVCCKSWMHNSLWSKFSKFYTIALKQLFYENLDLKQMDDLQSEQFVLSQVFVYSCDFLSLLETIPCTDGACKSVFVLLVDVLTSLCTVTNLQLSVFASKHGQESSHVLYLKRNIVQLQHMLLPYIETIKCDEMEDALAKKLLCLL